MASKSFERMGCEDSHIIATDWLFRLNQNHSLVDSGPTNLAILLPFISQLLVESSSIADNDTSCSQVVSLQVDLPAEEQECPCSSAVTDSDSTATNSILDSRLSTPNAALVMHARRSSLKLPATVLFLHIPSPPSISECPTPSSFVSLVDDDDDTWSIAVDIDSVPPLQFRVPSPTAVPVKSSQSSWAMSSKYPHTVPLPFLDNFQRVVAAAPLHARSL